MTTIKEDGYRLDFEKLYLTYFSRMKLFAKEYVILDEDAENIVQDIFLELWEKRELFSLHTNLLAFLFTAIRNRSLNFLRHKTIIQDTKTKILDEYNITLRTNLISLESFNESAFDENNIEKIISNALEQLPEKCRQIFIMNKVEGKKQKEIAEELNISVNTVETQMGIAYKKLRHALKDYFLILLFLNFLS